MQKTGVEFSRIRRGTKIFSPKNFMQFFLSFLHNNGFSGGSWRHYDEVLQHENGPNSVRKIH